MANLTNSSTWQTNITSIADTDDVEGAPTGTPDNGIANVPHKLLADRTYWLYNNVLKLSGGTMTGTILCSGTSIDFNSGGGISVYDNTGFIYIINDGNIKSLAGGNIEHSGSGSIKHSGTGYIWHSSTGKILHSGAGNIEHNSTGHILHIGAGNIQHIGTGSIKHSGTGHIEHAGSGNIKITGSGQFEGKGTGLNGMFFRRRNILDWLKGCCVYDNDIISKTTAPNISVDTSQNMIFFEWQYDEINIGYKLCIPALVPNDYNTNGSFYIVAKTAGAVSAFDIDGVFYSPASTAHGFANGSSGLLNSATVNSSSWAKYQLTLSSGAFVAGAYYQIELYVTNVIGGSGASDLCQVKNVYFDCDPKHN